MKCSEPGVVGVVDPDRRRLLLHTGAAAVPLALGLSAPWAVRAAGAKPPIFVLNSLEASVSVIDAHSYAEVKRLPVGKEPHHLYLTPDEKSLIVANAVGNSLTFIDPLTAQVQREIQRIADPYHLRFSPDMKWLVTAANRLNHVDLYRWVPQAAQPLELVKRVPAARTPSHLAMDSRSSVVYASLQDSDELVAIDLTTQAVRWKVKTGKMPADLFLLPDDRTLLIGLTGDRHVEVFQVEANGARSVKRIATGDGAHAFRARGDGKQVLVSNRVGNTISLIDMARLEVVGQLPAPGGPDCMEVLSDRRTVLVTSRWARKLTVIDIEQRQVIRQVGVGKSPHGVWTLDHAPRV